MSQNGASPIAIGALCLLATAWSASPAEAANRYWILASGTGNWDATANWSTTSGGSGGASVPGSADIANFGVNTAKDGSCTINAAVDVAGLSIAAGYDGTISQNGYTITIGASHFSQSGGTLNLAGTVNATGNWTKSGGVLNAGASTVEFGSQGSTQTVTGSQTLNNVIINCAFGSYTVVIAAGTTLTVTGTLTLRTGYLSGAGTLAAQGDIVLESTWNSDGIVAGNLLINGGGNQLLAGSPNASTVGGLGKLTITKGGGILTLAGTIDTIGDWTWTQGQVNPGTSTVHFLTYGGGGTQTVTGSQTLNNVIINCAFGSYTVAVAAGTTLTVTGTLTLRTGYLSGAGTLAAQGDIVLESTWNSDGIVAGNPLINGGGNQLFTGTANTGSPLAGLSNLTIAKGGGILTLAGTIDSIGAWTWTQGQVDPGSSTVRFVGYDTTVTGSHPLANVVMSKQLNVYTTTLAAGTTLTVNGNLTLSTGAVNTGTIAAKGNVSIGSACTGGTAALLFNGTAGNQTFSSAVNVTYPVTINKPSAAVVLTSDVFLGAGVNFTITAGTLDLAGFKLNVSATLTNNGTILAPGAGVKPITAGTLTTGGVSTITYTGVPADSPITLEKGVYYNLVVNNPGTTFSLSGATTVNGDLTIQGGTLDATTNNYSLTVGGNWNNSGAFTARAGAVTLSGSSQGLTGATPFYNLSKSVTTATILTLPAGLTTTVTGTLSLSGTSGNLLYLRSSLGGTRAPLTLSGGGTQALCYLNVQDIDASGGLALSANGSADSGNNLNWVFSPIACTPSSGLIGYWKLDNNANDSVGSANGTLVGGPTFVATPSPAPGSTHALSVSGGSYVRLTDIDFASGPFAISAWYKTSIPVSAFGAVVSKASTVDGNSGRIYLAVATGGEITPAPSIEASVNDGAWQGVSPPSSNAVYTDGNWHHVVLNVAASDMELFFDGASKGTAPHGSSLTTNNDPWIIGNELFFNDVFNGQIDDVRMYNRTLSGTEINQLAAKGGTGILTLKDAVTSSAAVTNSTTMTAGFASLEGTATQAQLSNVSGSFGAAASGFATPAFNAAWTVPAGDGDKVVYARITNGATTYDISDIITLDTVPPAAPTNLTLVANSDNTAITATATAPASADVSKLKWRYNVLEGNVAPSYPSTATSGTALGTGITSGVTPSSVQAITGSSLTQLKTYCVAVWAEDKAGNISASGAQAYLYLSPPTARLSITAPGSAAQAGGSATLTIAAKDADGNAITSYAGPYSLTWTPTGGSAVTLVSSSSSGFSSGSTTAAVSVGGSNAGGGTFTATDESGSALTSGTLSFTWYPASFTVSASVTSLPAGKPLSLTVTAKDSAGTTMTRYAGTVNLSISATPTATKSLSTTSLAVSSGTATISSLTYSDWASTATITVSDTTYVSGVTITGSSSALTFGPAAFLVVLRNPPPNRSVWYPNEGIKMTVTAMGYDGSRLINYRGTLAFDSISGVSVPSNYTFTAADGGSHEFTNLTATSAGLYAFRVSDTVASSAIGFSGPVMVVAARVVVANVSGPVGTLSIPIRIVDPIGILIPDYTTTFSVQLSEGTANGSAHAASAAVTFYNGYATLSVTDPEAEAVTVSGFTTPTLLVNSGTVNFGSSTSTSTSLSNLLQFEQTPGTIGSNLTSTTSTTYTNSTNTTTAYPTTSFYNFIPPSTTSGTQGTSQTSSYTPYDVHLLSGLQGLQSAYSPSFVNPQTGTSFSNSFNFPMPTTSSGSTYSPAAIAAATGGMPAGLAAMMGSAYSGQAPSGFGHSEGMMPWAMPFSNPSSSSSMGQLPTWMKGAESGGLSFNFSPGQGPMSMMGSFDPSSGGGAQGSMSMGPWMMGGGESGGGSFNFGQGQGPMSMMGSFDPSSSGAQGPMSMMGSFDPSSGAQGSMSMGPWMMGGSSMQGEGGFSSSGEEKPAGEGASEGQSSGPAGASQGGASTTSTAEGN